MNSRCLYCDKRLSLFHGRKKPFCSDEHEDLHLARVASSGLDRLRDDFVDSGPARPPQPNVDLPPKPSEQFSYPEIEPGFFDDDFEPARVPAPKIFNHPPRPSADGIPPAADYLISSGNRVQPAPPTIPFRNPAQAAFSGIEWPRPILFEGSPHNISAASDTPPPLVTSLQRLPMPLFTMANLPVNLDHAASSELVSAVFREALPSALPRLEAQPADVTVEKPVPEIPAMLTSFASVPTAAVRLADPDTPRTFRDFTLDAAVPRLIYPPPHRAPKFESQTQSTEAPLVILGPQVLDLEPLPQPQPLRFRTLLDLRGSAFRPFTHRLAPARLAPLSWNPAPPEGVVWRLSVMRRRPAPMLPNLTPSQRLQTNL